MNVKVIDAKTGQLKTMSKRYAEILVRLKRASWPAQEAESHAPKATKAAAGLAESSGIDLADLVGTGNDGTITKPDVEAAIAAAVPQE